MNDGIAAMVVQWCLICFVWMGSLNRLLSRLHVSQAQALACLAACLLCAFSNWRMYVLPVEISVSGLLLPISFSAWLWVRMIRPSQARYLMAALITLTSVLYLVRRLFIWDPLLMVMEDTLLLPLLLNGLIFLLCRRVKEQAFLLFMSVPLFDAAHALSLWGKMSPFPLGSPFSQDVLWLSLFVWSIVWSFILMLGRSRLIGSLKSKLHTHR